jgi:hypothetical protein
MSEKTNKRKTAYKSNRKSVKNTRRKATPRVNVFINNWIPYGKGKIFSPLDSECYHIPTNTGCFLKIFKWLMMQYPIRKYFVLRHLGNEMEYYMVKLDYIDPLHNNKVNAIKNIIDNKDSFVIDMAEQLSEGGGGHWTSVKKQNNQIIYMDSDPISYGSEAESQHSDFHQLFETLPKPENIYGNENTIKSIQNVHVYDTFCQSWSLLFLTTPNDFNINGLYFQEGKINMFTNNKLNFEPFIRINFIFIIKFWITLFSQEQENINMLLQQSQWRNWEADHIVIYLNNLKEWIDHNNTNDIYAKRNGLFKA